MLVSPFRHHHLERQTPKPRPQKHTQQICNHADLAAGADADGHDIMRGLVAGGGWREDWAEEEEEDGEVGGWLDGRACVSC